MNVRRKSCLLVVCLLFYCFFPVSGHAIDAETRLQNVTVVSDDNYPPYIFRDSNGVIQGILVDEWKLWEKKTGIKINLIAMDWSKAQEFFLRGNADVIDTIFFTEERAKQYDFTKPYATIDVPVFFHKNLGGIIDIASLQGFTIGVKAGDACIEVLKKQGITSFKEYNSYETIVNAAVNGEIKVFSIDKPPAFYYLYKMNFENEFRYSFNLYTGEFHRAVKKGRTDLLKMVEDGFALINRKEHDGIEKKWMGQPFVRPVFLRYVLFAFLFAGLLFLVLIFFNITLRRKVRSKTSELQDLVNQLRLSEERFRVMFEQAAVGVAICDSRSGDHIRVNQRYCDFVGYTLEEIKQLSFQKITYPQDLQADLNNMKLLMEGKIREFSMEKRYYRKDGSIVWGNLTVSPMWKEGENPNFNIAIVEDITERKLSEEALRKSEEKYRTIFENIQDVYYEASIDGTILEISPSIEKVSQYDRNELFGKSIYDIYVNPKERGELLKLILDKGKVSGFEVTLTDKDGSQHPCSISTLLIRDEQANPIKLVGTIRDISERKRAENERKQLESQLLQAQKMESIGNLAGGIAHDFNNILTSVIGYTELSLDEVEKGTHIEDNLQEVYTAGKRAKDLVRQILAFARQSEEELKAIQIDTIAIEVLKFIRSSIPTTIEIKQNIESDSLIMGNATQIHQILMNLFTNAAHAMEDTGGILEFGLKDVLIDRGVTHEKLGLKPGNYIELKVSDNGVGIAPEIIDSIFDPYFTTKGPGEGTGMGLAMVHGTIESYGGKISVDSKPGQGTLFTIYLPVTRKRHEDRPYQLEELPTGTERILFVDDEAPIAKIGGQALQRLGYTVSIRTSSKEALELFRTKPNDFDLVITDMTMPNMTGDSLANELMKIRPDIPVILCTGYSKNITDETAAKIGIKAFAYKPIVKADLAKIVRKVLDEAKGSAQE
ncbi:MAG: hypothetical protein DRH24_17435 [Deltaproteobacteria bacterium]|nr:MAG: hypothetical protein DRH24_17435 [Deltaproteobacteria bacterium]